MKNYFYLIIVLFYFIGCQEFKSEITWDVPIESIKEVTPFDTQIEEFYLDNFESSYDGKVTSINDTLVFIDYKFGWLFYFDDKGTVVERKIGSGNTLKEIPTLNISFVSKKPDGGLLFIGNSHDIHNFDKNLNREGSYYINWNSNKSIKYLSNNPEPNNAKSYNLAYNIGEIKTTKQSVYLPLASPPPLNSSFNLTTDFYAKNARILAEMDINTGKIQRLLGYLPPKFYSKPANRLFSNIIFDISNKDDVYLTFQADSLIYKFDMNVEKIQKKFGFSGKDMSLNYQPFPDQLNQIKLKDYWKKQSTEKGYYNYLEYFDEFDLLIRGYKKGIDKSNGLQFYRNEKLIVDLNIPRDFIPATYIEPYFYSNVVKDEKGAKLYRLKLPKNEN